ncbi:lipid II:glycine glycyltransferase FemX [Conyzicola sp.]|uniref:lipid II:glycine glycyltransferase FemX n=1 Tax=Conyzicola sp. TaxID=1969404 RepID=UPI0039897FC4
MQSEFTVWDASKPVDRDAWIAAWSATDKREVYNHPDYVALFAGGEDAAVCAYLASDDGTVLYPFIRRTLAAQLDDTLAGVSDLITPYGYGGPQAWVTGAATELAAQFWASFGEWATSQNVVTEFIRFGLFADTFLPYPGDVVTRSTNIIISLEGTDDQIWMGFEQKVRKNVKKALRNEISVTVDESGEFLDDFLRIYAGTLDRRDADSGYFFPRSFFETIIERLPGQFAFFHARLGGTIISTELVLVSDESIYSFLGGTDSAAFEFRPNDLLKFEVVTWGRSQGKKHFVLGGGPTPGDGIERYKRSFAPNGAVDFKSGQRILQPALNAQLVAARRAEFEAADREWPDESRYFPEYRLV